MCQEAALRPPLDHPTRHSATNPLVLRLDALGGVGGRGLGFGADGEEVGLAGHVHGAVRHDGGAVYGSSEVGLAQDLRLGPALGGQHHEVAVLVADIHFTVGH